jgi:hypothetical protein
MDDELQGRGAIMKPQHVVFFAKIQRLEKSISIYEVSGSHIPFDLLELMTDHSEFYDINGDAFENTPLHKTVNVRLAFVYDQGDLSVGMWPGWLVEEVVILSKEQS